MSKDQLLHMILKRSLHEIGHLFGLGHCHNKSGRKKFCSMTISEDIANLTEISPNKIAEDYIEGYCKEHWKKLNSIVEDDKKK